MGRRSPCSALPVRGGSFQVGAHETPSSSESAQSADARSQVRVGIPGILSACPYSESLTYKKPGLETPDIGHWLFACALREIVGTHFEGDHFRLFIGHPG